MCLEAKRLVSAMSLPRAFCGGGIFNAPSAAPPFPHSYVAFCIPRGSGLHGRQQAVATDAYSWAIHWCRTESILDTRLTTKREELVIEPVPDKFTVKWYNIQWSEHVDWYVKGVVSGPYRPTVGGNSIIVVADKSAWVTPALMKRCWEAKRTVGLAKQSG
jgi:hypothetical protein